jgi:hypothetical protein
MSLVWNYSVEKHPTWSPLVATLLNEILFKMSKKYKQNKKLCGAEVETVHVRNCGRFANESFRQLSFRQRLGSIRQRTPTFLCQFANVTQFI